MLREASSRAAHRLFPPHPLPRRTNCSASCPNGPRLLRGVLGADLVAFHTHDYMRHFIGTAERVLHIDFRLDETQIGNRCVRVDALPMGIDYAAFHGISSNAGASTR